MGAEPRRGRATGVIPSWRRENSARAGGGATHWEAGLRRCRQRGVDARGGARGGARL